MPQLDIYIVYEMIISVIILINIFYIINLEDILLLLNKVFRVRRLFLLLIKIYIFYLLKYVFKKKNIIKYILKVLKRGKKIFFKIKKFFKNFFYINNLLKIKIFLKRNVIQQLKICVKTAKYLSKIGYNSKIGKQYRLWKKGMWLYNEWFLIQIRKVTWDSIIVPEIKIGTCIKIGALTDKFYQFQSRAWELNIICTYDIFDSLGSNIKVFLTGAEIKRILPLKNDFINDEWISNVTRYFFENLAKWRLNIPLIKITSDKIKKIKKYIRSGWKKVLNYFLLNIYFYNFFFNSRRFILINGYVNDLNSIVTSRFLLKKIGFFLHNDNININDFYLYYLNVFFFKEILIKKIYIFLGINLRLESPILNLKLRKSLLLHKKLFCMIGSSINDNLNSINLGTQLIEFFKFLKGKFKKVINNIFVKLNKINIDYLYILGNNVLQRFDIKNIYMKLLIIIKKYFNKIFKKNIFDILLNRKISIKINSIINIVYLNLTHILYNELNLKNNVNVIEKILKYDILYLLGMNMMQCDKMHKNNFSIFQGHHLMNFNVDIIFPTTTFLEKNGDYLNIEGSILSTNLILHPPLFCRNDWSILNVIYIYLLYIVKKIYNINNKVKIKKNYLNFSRFYILFNNIKKIFFFVKKISMNFYYIEISRIFKFLKLNIILKKHINIIFNTLLNNKLYNIYNIDMFRNYLKFNEQLRGSISKKIYFKKFYNFWNILNFNKLYV